MEQEAQEPRNAPFCVGHAESTGPAQRSNPGAPGASDGAPPGATEGPYTDPLALSWARTPMRKRLFADTVKEFSTLAFAHACGTVSDPAFVVLAEERIAVLRALAEDPQVSESLLRLEGSLWNAVARAFAQASDSPPRGAIG